MSKILRLFVSTFTADDTYSLLNRDNLTRQIQMQLSENQKDSSQFLSYVLKPISSFEYFRKEDDTHSLCISKIADYEKRA